MAEPSSIKSVEQLHAEWCARGGRGHGLHSAQRKLTPSQVMEIRHLYASRVRMKEISKRFQTSLATLYPIVSGRVYQHLPMPPMIDLSLPGEEWRDVVGWNGQYSVSNLARVRRESRGSSTRPGRVLRAEPNFYGYLCVTLPVPNSPTKRSIRKPVHILVARAFLGPCPDGMEVNHIHQDRRDNRPENLEYITHEANIQHAHLNRKRGVYRGLNGIVPTAVILESDALKIQLRLLAGDAVADIARTFGISPLAVEHLHNHEKWLPARIYYDRSAIGRKRRKDQAA